MKQYQAVPDLNMESADYLASYYAKQYAIVADVPISLREELVDAKGTAGLSVAAEELPTYVLVAAERKPSRR